MRALLLLLAGAPAPLLPLVESSAPRLSASGGLHAHGVVWLASLVVVLRVASLLLPVGPGLASAQLFFLPWQLLRSALTELLSCRP